MRTIYLRKEDEKGTRKVLLDMAYLVAHKQIRLLKYKFEEGLYLRYLPNPKDQGKVEQLILTKDKIKSEDENYFYFSFNYKANQVEPVAE